MYVRVAIKKKISYKLNSFKVLLLTQDGAVAPLGMRLT